MKVFQKIIAWYFLLGAIASFCIYVFKLPEGNFFLYLIPNLIAATVFITYVIICLLYLKNFDENTYKTLFIVMLLIQNLQLRLNGYVFVNYYLPEASLYVDLKNSETFKFTGDLYKIVIVIANGYFKDNNTLQIGVNFIGIFLMIISSLKSKTENNSEPLFASSYQDDQ